MYSNQYDFNNYQYPMEYQDDRFLFTPFLVGGLAGTALGLGIANNNQINNPPYIPYPNYHRGCVFPKNWKSAANGEPKRNPVSSFY